MTQLQIQEAVVRFGETVAVDRVSLDLDQGQVLAVLGPSGCGKSSLLRAVAGLEPLAGGAIRDAGRDLAGVPAYRRGFALMFQDGQLFDHLDVAGNVGYPLRIRRRRDPGRVAELLDLVGLSGYAARMPAELSGGERQRVALARALAVEPRLLLLDEPLSALDATLRERLAGDLRDILRLAGTTALFVTHDQEEAFTVADRLAVMQAGRLLQHGDIDQVWRNPVDAGTAMLLGYAVVLDGTAAAVVSSGIPADSARGAQIALRRSALRIDDDGPMTGRIRSVRTTPEHLRLEVEVEQVGVVPAVTGLDRPVAVGQRVRVSLDPSRAAVIGS